MVTGAPTDEFILKAFGISRRLLDEARITHEEILPVCQAVDSLAEYNQLKVLNAFREAGIGEHHFAGTTGYGYHDPGRERLEEVFRLVFGAEAAIVRPQLVSGTHSISVCLFGLLRHGDHLLIATGKPYDTLDRVIGISDETSGKRYDGSLASQGISCSVVPLGREGGPDIENISAKLVPNTKVVLIQRSRGYSWRPSLRIEDISLIARVVHQKRPEAVVFVDNCYGEFVEDKEPIEAGADLVAGSLIKNPGGGLAPSGGYIVGRKDLIERVSDRLVAPGIGMGCGPMLGLGRPLFQGFFVSPSVVGEALKGAIFAARLLSGFGYPVAPAFDEPRGDIVQGVLFGSREKLLAFCEGFHMASPVGAYETPEPGAVPGYTCEIIMAGGTFVQGSSIELSVDGPLRPPYAAFIQGGFVKGHARAAVLCGLQRLIDQSLAKP